MVCANIINITDFGIAKDKRGPGIGKRWMNALFEWCETWCETRNIDEIRLEVFNKNVGAYHFYGQYEFVPLEQKMNLRVKKG